MHIFLEVVRCVLAAFFAAWAISLNELRFSTKEYDSRWIWLLVIGLLIISFGVLTIHV